MTNLSFCLLVYRALPTPPQRTRLYHTRSYQYESIVKKTEQMYALLGLCVALYPQRVDDGVLAALREKLADKYSRLLRGSVTYPPLMARHHADGCVR